MGGPRMRGFNPFDFLPANEVESGPYAHSPRGNENQPEKEFYYPHGGGNLKPERRTWASSPRDAAVGNLSKIAGKLVSLGKLPPGSEVIDPEKIRRLSDDDINSTLDFHLNLLHEANQEAAEADAQKNGYAGPFAPTTGPPNEYAGPYAPTVSPERADPAAYAGPYAPTTGQPEEVDPQFSSSRRPHQGMLTDDQRTKQEARAAELTSRSYAPDRDAFGNWSLGHLAGSALDKFVKTAGSGSLAGGAEARWDRGVQMLDRERRDAQDSMDVLDRDRGYAADMQDTMDTDLAINGKSVPEQFEGEMAPHAFDAWEKINSPGTYARRKDAEAQGTAQGAVDARLKMAERLAKIKNLDADSANKISRAIGSRAETQKLLSELDGKKKSDPKAAKAGIEGMALSILGSTELTPEEKADAIHDLDPSLADFDVSPVAHRKGSLYKENTGFHHEGYLKGAEALAKAIASVYMGGQGEGGAFDTHPSRPQVVASNAGRTDTTNAINGKRPD